MNGNVKKVMEAVSKNDSLIDRIKNATHEDIPTMVMHHSSPERHQLSPQKKPPKINHRMFPISSAGRQVESGTRVLKAIIMNGIQHQ